MPDTPDDTDPICPTYGCEQSLAWSWNYCPKCGCEVGDTDD